MKTIPFHQVTDFYSRNQPAGHWFDAASCKFFKTVLPDVAYETTAGVLFITRETNPSGLKRFSVRRQLVSGEIETVGDFHCYTSKAWALKAITQLDKGEPV